ncbi:MAG: hypothetical protein AAFW47_04775 [Pseudomonadota bacterium]
MHIVPIPNTRFPVRRVDRVLDTRAAKTVQRDDETFAADPAPQSLRADASAFDGHTLLAAQVIASRVPELAGAQGSIAATAAYKSALTRKVVRLDTGTFYEDAA